MGTHGQSPTFREVDTYVIGAFIDLLEESKRRRVMTGDRRRCKVFRLVDACCSRGDVSLHSLQATYGEFVQPEWSTLIKRI